MSLMRILRIIRAIRLIKLVKITKVLVTIEDALVDYKVAMIFIFIKLMIFMLLVAH